MTRDEGKPEDGEQPGDKEKKPKGKSSFVPRWRQNQSQPLQPEPAQEPAPKPARFQARWRQNTVEPAPEPTPAPSTEAQTQSESKAEKKKFQARWRQNTVEPEPLPAPTPEPEKRAHPNLQQQPSAQQSPGKKFQPRWRQRAEEIAAKEEEARSQAPSPPENQDFQPRWRRTAASGPLTGSDAPLPGSDAPLEGSPQKAKGFKASWRERAEREPVPPPARAEFTPRWKRTMATEPPAPPLETPVDAVAEAPLEVVVETPAEAVAEAPLELSVEPALTEVSQPDGLLSPAGSEPIALALGQPMAEAPAAIQAAPLAQPVDLGGPPSGGLPAPLDQPPQAPVAEAEAAPPPSAGPASMPLATPLGAPLAPQASPLVTPLAAPLAIPLAAPLAAPVAEEPEETVELVAEAPVQVVAPPAAPEKKRLPRPQPPPPPKAAPPPAPPSEPPPTAPRPIVPIPNTEDDDYQPPTNVSVPAFLPGPEVLEARVEIARVERAGLVETELVEQAPRKVKRLDDEALAALKATANLVSRGAPLTAAQPPPAPPPPPPPVPPRPAQQPRYSPTPRAPSTGAISVARLKEAPPAPSNKSASPTKRFSLKGSARPASLEDVATFTRQFSVMISAGLPIHQALSFFAESSTGPLAEVMDDVATKISSGHRLSQAMSRHEAVFSEVYVGLVELGETSSHIDEALEKLADLLEKQVRLGKRLSSALVYPAFLVAVSMASIGVFLQYVLPTMIPLFASFSLELPLPTRMLLGSRHLVIPTAILAVLSVFAWKWFRPRLQKARRNKDKWAYDADKAIMRLPLLGKFFRQMATARVLFALATMIETGLPILNALKRCETVASNLAFAERLEKAGLELRDGATVTDALSLYEVLPPSCLHLISAGEESAQMAEMIQYAARFYEEEVEHSIDTFMSLVEPVIMVFMGIVVGFIVLSAVLPTVQMISHLGG
ncbi:MAG: type II secretion system F family protein [Vulcanimicrobiota bacterium]